MQCLILAGGLGTRLASRLAGSQKCMYPIGGRPFLQFLIERVKSAGIDEFILAVGHASDQVRAYFEEGKRLGVRIRYSFEESLLGTAGALRKAAALLSGDAVLAMNGDSLIEIDYGELIGFHAAQGKGPCLAFAVTSVPDAQDYGTVMLDERDRAVAFLEKGRAGSHWVNAGVYVIPTKWIKEIPTGKVVSLEKDWMPALIRERRPVVAYQCRGHLMDLGTPERLDRFVQEHAGTCSLGGPISPKE